MDETIQVPELKESVKLEKNSKGYNWEIKLFGNPLLDDSVLKRLQELNRTLAEKYV